MKIKWSFNRIFFVMLCALSSISCGETKGSVFVGVGVTENDLEFVRNNWRLFLDKMNVKLGQDFPELSDCEINNLKFKSISEFSLITNSDPYIQDSIREIMKRGTVRPLVFVTKNPCGKNRRISFMSWFYYVEKNSVHIFDLAVPYF